MEKYAVEIDKNKVPKEKVASKGGKDDEANVPLHPTKGTEPYERRPDAHEKETE